MFLLFYAMNLFYLSYLFIVVAGTDSSSIYLWPAPAQLARLATGRRKPCGTGSRRHQPGWHGWLRDPLDTFLEAGKEGLRRRR
jgi:hypothetical protein